MSVNLQQALSTFSNSLAGQPNQCDNINLIHQVKIFKSYLLLVSEHITPVTNQKMRDWSQRQTRQTDVWLVSKAAMIRVPVSETTELYWFLWDSIYRVTLTEYDMRYFIHCVCVKVSDLIFSIKVRSRHSIIELQSRVPLIIPVYVRFLWVICNIIQALDLSSRGFCNKYWDK